MLYRQGGIVIRSTDYGEGSKIITIYTETMGKIGVMARGAKKPRSRHGAVTQLFTYADFVFYKAGGQMGTLNHAETIDSHRRLREDLLLSAYASYLVELTDRLTADNEPDPFLFSQLRLALSALEEGKDAQIITHLYEMKMLARAGYAPNLERCAVCGGEPAEMTISFQLGGAVCPLCRSGDPEAVRLTEKAYKLLRLLAAADIGRIGQIDVKPETKMQLKKVMRGFFDAHIGIRWRSQHVMDQIEKYGV